MAGVFDIDEAWTEKESSGVTLLEGCTRRVAVAPGYDSSLSLARGASLGRARNGSRPRGPTTPLSEARP
jgi:hypothetical protein